MLRLRILCLWAAALLVGCGDLDLRKVTIQGQVLLQGQPSGHYGGSSVTLEGITDITDSAGNYSIAGYVGGADAYTLTFSHPGYTSRQVSGKLPYDPSSKPSDEKTLDIDTISLQPE